MKMIGFNCLNCNGGTSPTISGSFFVSKNNRLILPSVSRDREVRGAVAGLDNTEGFFILFEGGFRHG